SSSAGILAVVEPTGSVRAVVGQDSLRGVDLQSTSVLKSAGSENVVDAIWSFSDRMLVVAVAPIPLGAHLRAYVVVATEPSDATPRDVARPLGVAGAVVIGDQIPSATAKDEEIRADLAAVASFPPDELRRLPGRARRFGRLSRLDPAGR